MRLGLVAEAGADGLHVAAGPATDEDEAHLLVGWLGEIPGW